MARRSSSWLDRAAGGVCARSPLIAPRIVCVVVVRLRRGFIGGMGGVLGMPLLRLAPGGNETMGTLEVLDTNMGSEICALDTCLFGRPLPPGTR